MDANTVENVARMIDPALWKWRDSFSKPRFENDTMDNDPRILATLERAKQIIKYLNG